MAGSTSSAAARVIQSKRADDYEEQIVKAAACTSGIQPRVSPIMAVAITAREVKGSDG